MSHKNHRLAAAIVLLLMGITGCAQRAEIEWADYRKDPSLQSKPVRFQGFGSGMPYGSGYGSGMPYGSGAYGSGMSYGSGMPYGSGAYGSGMPYGSGNQPYGSGFLPAYGSGSNSLGASYGSGY